MIRAGLHSNCIRFMPPLTDNDAGPFGRMRLSGMGRELGIEGLEGFRDSKHVHLDYKIRRMPDWIPYDWSSLKKS